MPRTKRVVEKRTVGSPGQRIFADVMNTRELAAHRRRGGIVMLPLGCFEMHGVQASMSCDTFLVEAACRVAAPLWKAVMYPPIHYTYPGASGPWPGTVRILPRDTLNYVIAVMKAILENGFKRLVLVSLHGPNAPMITLALRTVFEEMGEIPVCWAPNYDDFCERVRKRYGENHSEAALLLASMYICGRHGEFDPAAPRGVRLEGPKFPFPSFSKLRRHRVDIPYYFTEPNHHVGLYPGLTLDDGPRLAQMWRDVVLESARGLPEDYAKYQKDMWRAMKRAPWKFVR